MNMKCPKCQHELQSYEFKGLHLDECENCGGKWFDRDELRQAKDRTDDDFRWLDFDLFEEKDNKYERSPSKKICPKDSSKMTALTYMNSKVVVDKCDTCKGVWLDKSELERILKFVEHVVVATPASEYGKETLKEFSEIFTGPENTISEIKDFMSITNLFSLRSQVEHPWTIALSDAIQRIWPLR